MSNWVDLGPLNDFPDGEHVCTTAGGKPIVLFHVDGELFAIRNQCPHAGLPLGQGPRHGLVITCPFHGYAYNIKTGRNIDWPEDELPVKTYPVRLEEQTVQIDLGPDPTPRS